MKRILLSIAVIAFISSSIFAQNNVLKYSDKNFHLLKAVLEGKNTATGSGTEKGMEEKEGSSLVEITQISKNKIDDVELFSAINPTNPDNIVISWMETTMTTISFILYYSNDGGTTWNPATIDLSGGAGQIVGGGDPVFAFDTNGKLYFSWLYLSSLAGANSGDRDLTMQLYWAYSDDNGKTFSRAGNGEDIITDGIFFYTDGEIKETKECCPPDKQWMSVDPVTNDLYVSLTEFGDIKVLQNIWGVRKLKSGTTKFSEKVLIPADTTKAPTAGAVVADRKGNVHTVFPSWPDTLVPQQVIQYAYSSDSGATYSDPVTVAHVDVKYFAGAPEKNETERVYKRLNPMTYIAVDNSGGSYDGRVYICWNGWDNDDVNGVDIFLSYSDDLGQTWSEPKRVNDDEEGEGKTQHRPSIYVNNNGVLILSWFDGRKAEGDKELTSFYVGVSKDGGETIINRNISDYHHNMPFDMQEVSVFWLIGEYYQLVATDEYIYPFWAAKSGGDVEIFMSKLNIDSFENIGISEMSPVSDKIAIESIYPNPVSDQVNINIKLQQETNISGVIYNIEGKLIEKISPKEYTDGKHKITIPVNNYKAGSYYITFDTDYGQLIRKFIKE